ncbi:translocation/assembly module TamB domain-containing protein [Sulfurovum sp. NBC37-1]|uniref:translocation/assembly module TamB domain-containing protein n=1 Tax=Sulfurovum sp. (strain NBC37-1) TaxID=387093 RepID=UPI0001587BF6|nr:translocation/assembly module TamB domain-containing protein [Sulfurovum sp. NBC37-1]BAF72525.1 hypothetical protein SUN_1575 [Sulfurovum sp. NBC37-1]
MKKFFYGILIFFVSLIVIIVVAANSSFVIKKVADIFAPDYNITYSDITGNVFTGVKINGLKYADMKISKQIRFSWNPSKILYKRIAISEISGENVDVDAVKALIASFPKSVEEDDNSSSAPFPLVVTVGKVHITVNPFKEQGILFKKTLLNAEDISYASDEVEVGDLQVQVDTNVTDLKLQASLEDGKVTVKDLSIDEIDSETLQAMFMPKENNATEKETSKTAGTGSDEPLNPLIPREAVIEHFSASLKPRSYLDANIDKLKVNIDDLKTDITKILDNKQSAISVSNYALEFKSDIGQAEIAGMLKNDTVTVKKLDIIKVDTLALKAMFAPDSNESNGSIITDEKIVKAETKVEHTAVAAPQEQNALIPKKVVIKSVHADILPATFEPARILSFALDAKNIEVNVPEQIVEKGTIDLNATTNFSNITEKGSIEKNRFKGHIVLSPQKHLFDLYELPLSREAIGDIGIDIAASQEKATVDIDTRAKQILLVKTDVNATDMNGTDTNASKPFNVDIDQLKTHVAYLLKEGSLRADTNIKLSTPYAKDITITNNFAMDGNISYSGKIKSGELAGLDAKLLKPINNLLIAYSGTDKSVKTDINAEGIKGYFIAKDLKKSGIFHLETKHAVEVGKMVVLPPELNATKVNAVIDVPLNFAKLTPIKGKAKISSNVANVDADIVYGDVMTLKAVTKIPDDSLLKNFDKNIHWNAISPLTANAKMSKKDITASLKSSKISATMDMKPADGTVNGKIRLAGLITTMKGKTDGDIVIKSDIGSFSTLLGTVKEFYTVEDLPKVDGKLDLSLVINKKREAALKLTSPQIIYHVDRKTDQMLDDVSIVLGLKGQKLELSSYQLTYSKMKFFATKPSVVEMKDGTVTIAQLWLNDQLKVTGQLDTKTMKGEILADAPTFHLAHEMVDLDSKINIKTKFNGTATDVNGKVTLLGGNVHYDLGAKSFPSDSDIVIVQDMKPEKPNPFMDNLTINMIVNSEKPLVYKQGDIDMKANADIKVLKAINSDPMVLGQINLVKGGTYDFQGKRFVVEKGNIYLTGDPNKPLLDIEVDYQAENYLITIMVSGTPAVPVINFSSKPSLSREQILSVILFDSEEGAGSNSSEDMMKMMGGAMAKSVLANAGVKIDYLAIGADGSMAIGKKLTDNITVIYKNEEVSSVELKYKHSPRTESVLEFDEISQSYDIVYKRDMSQDDIIKFVGGEEKKK